MGWRCGWGWTVKGEYARKVLLRCLACQVQLLGDWDCRTEYCRTLSVALLQWQPWYSTLPGCCFVEEGCEAMLSRVVGRCRANAGVVDFDGLLDLYVTLPPPANEPRQNRGFVPPTLRTLFLHRLKRMIRHPQSQPYARVTSAKEAQWEVSFPEDHRFPSPLNCAVGLHSFGTVLQSAVVSVTSPGVVNDDVRAFREVNWIPVHMSAEEEAVCIGVNRRIQQWGAARRQRMKQKTTTSAEANVTRTEPFSGR